MKLRIIAAALLIAAGGISAHARFMNLSVQVPVDRAVSNVEKWIKEKPQDAQAYYVLGRLHAMAWAYGPELNLWRSPAARGAAPGEDPFNGELPGFAPFDGVQVRRDEQKKELTAADAGHLRDAIKNYRKAAELDPKSAIYELGLAWLLQETGKVALQLSPEMLDLKPAEQTESEKAATTAAIANLGAAEAKARDEATAALVAAMPGNFEQLRAAKPQDPEIKARLESVAKQYFELQALAHYRKAYNLALAEDLAARGGLKKANTYISAEAGEAILQILAAHPAKANPNELRDIRETIRKIEEKPMAITPIIFSMPGRQAREVRAVGDLLDAASRTRFDLAGDGVVRDWPWVRPGVSLLVWDPAQTGRITSGRMLFGSATWWIAFRDGYEALSILDDNRDGQLRDSELAGIAVWTDENANGISDKGEVQSLAHLGITAIATQPQTAADGTLTATQGIIFADGRAVPSFDWVTEPAAYPRPLPGVE